MINANINNDIISDLSFLLVAYGNCFYSSIKVVYWRLPEDDMRLSHGTCGCFTCYNEWLEMYAIHSDMTDYLGKGKVIDATWREEDPGPREEAGEEAYRESYPEDDYYSFENDLRRNREASEGIGHETGDPGGEVTIRYVPGEGERQW